MGMAGAAGEGGTDAGGTAGPPTIDTSTAHPARVYDYWLGGKDNFAADREAAEQALQAYPQLAKAVQSNRAFLARAVRYLTQEAGIRQFLDIGTGLPTANNTHEVAQRVAPDSCVVYVDNDRVVLAHARALLTSSPQGTTACLDADLQDPDTILDAATRTLDFTQPIALMLMGILGHFDYDEARSVVKRLLDPLPSRSYFALNDGINVFNQRFVQAQETYNQSGAVPYHLRSPEQIAGFFEGLELVEPGLVSCPHWRRDPADDSDPDAGLDAFGGVARKP